MSVENTFDKVKLISELKDIHAELFEVYRKLYDFKYKNDEEFKIFIDSEYKENGVGSKEKKAWDDNFCHRASYTLLNKILFVRICEDKGFMLNTEDYIAGEVNDPHIGKKLSKIGLQKWSSLVTNYTLGELVKFAFNDMKKSYNNIILYKEDKYEILNPKDEEFRLKYVDGDETVKDLILEFEKVLNDIIEKLDTNNFNFKHTDGNVLGDVYEKFMDRETRKAIGQFYTPEFVIEYVLKNTVSEAEVVENPFVTVADISCGSGHFLIMAYDILKEKFLSNIEKLREKYAEELYKIKRNGKEQEITGEEYWVKENVHYHILKHCIYGADLDSFAVQLSTINLLLKDLDNFTDELNIIECDSLIKWEEDYDWKNLKEQLEEEFQTVVTTQINLFGEEEKSEQKVRKENYKLKYKDVSGREREERISREKAEEMVNTCEFWSKRFDYVVGNPPYIPVTKINALKKKYYKEKYIYAEGRINTFSLFIERVLSNIKNKNLAYIIPSRILLNTQYSKIREYLLEKTQIKKILDLSEGIFEDAVVDTIVIIIDNILPQNNRVDVEKYVNQKIIKKQFLQDTYLDFDNSYINIYIDNKEMEFLRKINEKSIKLNEISDIKDGIIQGAVGDLLFLHNKKQDTEKCKKVLYGENILSYQINWRDEYIDYDKEMLTKIEDDRTKGKGRGLRLRTPEIFERPKILSRQTADRIIAALDLNNCYYMNTLHGTHIISSNYDHYYVLAIMNSSLINFYYTKYNYEVGKTFAQVKIENLKNLPIPKINKESQLPISILAKQINELNENYLKLEFNLNGIEKEKILSNFIEIEKEKSLIKAKINKNSMDIDFSIYKNLDINEEEKILIENSRKNKTMEREYLIKNNLYKYDLIKEAVLQICRNELTYDRFITEHIQNNKSIEEIALEFGYEYITVHNLRELYSEELEEEQKYNMYNMKSLINHIYKVLNMKNFEICKKETNYLTLDNIVESMKKEVDNFDCIVEVLRINNSKLKIIEIIRNVINIKKYTWKEYRKKIKNMQSYKQYLVNYYDNKYYGLTEWSDEVHKKYFMDAIDEYTITNPNEKKAKDILKLFKDLDIEDKEDYIEIIEGKIKRAFN